VEKQKGEVGRKGNTKISKRAVKIPRKGEEVSFKSECARRYSVHLVEEVIFFLEKENWTIELKRGRKQWILKWEKEEQS